MKKILSFLIARSKERSTWLGITSLIAALGLALTPEQADAIVVTGMALAGFITAFTRDNS